MIFLLINLRTHLYYRYLRKELLNVLMYLYGMSEADKAIIREFLLSPYNRGKFRSFYTFCYNFVSGYLRYLQKLSYQLPYDNRTDKDPIEDLTIDILGFFFARKKDKPFFVIYDYFSRLGIHDFRLYSDQAIYDNFVILLKGFIKRQLYRFRMNTNPQMEKLKRSCKSIFNDSDIFASLSIDGTDYIYLKSEKESLRRDKQPIPYETVEDIALDAFHKSKNIRQWCLKIFEQVKSLHDFRNMLSKYQLLTIMVKINSEFLESGDIHQVKRYCATDAVIHSDIKRAFESALYKLQTGPLLRYVHKQTITSDEKDLLYRACRNYLADYCANGGEADPIPVYFREMMPLETHERYLKDYKNVFESLIKKMLGFFAEEVKKSSTFRYISSY